MISKWFPDDVPKWPPDETYVMRRRPKIILWLCQNEPLMMPKWHPDTSKITPQRPPNRPRMMLNWPFDDAKVNTTSDDVKLTLRRPYNDSFARWKQITPWRQRTLNNGILNAICLRSQIGGPRIGRPQIGIPQIGRPQIVDNPVPELNQYRQAVEGKAVWWASYPTSKNRANRHCHRLAI